MRIIHKQHPDLLLIGLLYTVQIMALILQHTILNIIYYAKHKAWLIKTIPQFALVRFGKYITCGPGTDTASPPPWTHDFDYVLASFVWSTKKQKKNSRIKVYHFVVFPLLHMVIIWKSLQQLWMLPCVPKYTPIHIPGRGGLWHCKRQSPYDVCGSNSTDNKSTSKSNRPKLSLEVMEC